MSRLAPQLRSTRATATWPFFTAAVKAVSPVLGS
eukprot:CAMPEP_0175988044 /NCGR_PEP_ID=MMETSP0108-20121206/51034_1 /TAXON_ID=195067 ORGANISM="Goniomonas pacifica, Strain CCMP1869" /NCGR_SAMPLE_ID=MMETSP0108 /ASSEMBLY_ACC=CAM_ASM_000204 /LENGTH=33 /DNA_ID= /DNA_START= /DNA_END= /DNA_ORIENTATION=